MVTSIIAHFYKYMKITRCFREKVETGIFQTVLSLGDTPYKKNGIGLHTMEI